MTTLVTGVVTALTSSKGGKSIDKGTVLCLLVEVANLARYMVIAAPLTSPSIRDRQTGDGSLSIHCFFMGCARRQAMAFFYLGAMV